MTKILVIDDEPDVVTVVRINLELAGYEVHEASDGRIGLELTRQLAPDAILLDVMMPVLDGWETLRELQADPATSHIPVVMLTAMSGERDVIRGHLQGAIRYVTKPFDMDVLLNTVEEALTPVDKAEAARRTATRTKLLRRLAELETGRSNRQAVRMSNLDGTPRDTSRALTDGDRKRAARLTDRQLRVAGMLAAGMAARDIAEEFEVSRSNIYATRKRIARKLEVTPEEVADEAARLGLTVPDGAN